MELFKSGLKSVLGGSQEGSQPTGADTIERLIERLQTSTLLEDRRDACRAIKALSRKYRVEVGAQGMESLVHVLEADRSDTEIVGYALDTLCNIVTPDVFEEEADEDGNPPAQELASIGEQFTEIFIKKLENVSVVLALLEEYDFHVRWPAVRLLTNLLTNKPKEIQEMVLISPMGVAKLVDLLSDNREIIRNDGLLLLVQLTRANANIQKIVAFENAFDKVLDVIVEEGFSDGGIVVEDCLNLLLNLLKNNTSNQTFFKEGSYIQRLTPFFTLPADSLEVGWSAQRVSNVMFMLQVIRTLVSPANPAHVLSQCQRSMKNCGILESLCCVLMASGVPADVLTETVNTVAELIRGCELNQEFFTAVVAPSNPPRPAIVVLLLSMINEKQPFSLRCAVLYCFQSFLYKNAEGQNQLVQTLLPSSNDGTPTITSGQLLCGGLFSPDCVSQWLSAVALSHALFDNPAQKEQLLRVKLATGVATAPISLLHQCILLLQKSMQSQTQTGILMLLCQWVANCPQAVSVLLSSPISVSHLTAQVGADEHDENQEVVQGIGAFLLGLCIQFNDNSVPEFTKDSLIEIISKRIGVDIFMDKLGEVSKHESYSRISKHPQLSARQPAALLYDHQFCKLFKASEGAVIKVLTPRGNRESLNGPSTEEESGPVVLRYKQLIRDQDLQIQDMRSQLNQRINEQDAMRREIEELRSTVEELSDQNALFKAQQLTSTSPISTDGNEQVTILQTKVVELQKQLQMKDDDLRTLEMCNEADMESLKSQYEEQLVEQKKQLAQQITEAKEETELVNTELIKTQKDQDDLLEMLTDQDSRIAQYKEKLIALGQKVDDDDIDENLTDDLITDIE